MRRIRIVLLASLVALVAVPAAFAIRFTDDSYNMPTGVVGQPYSKQFNGAGGCGPALPYQYSLIAGNLPPGLSLASSGLISGTPTTAGNWSFWVDLSDQNPPSATWCRPSEAQRQFTITVTGGTPPVALKISQSALSPSTLVENRPFSFQFAASGGGTQTWSIQSGTLPAGLTLSSAGVLSGTATVTGDFTFKVQVSDGTRSDAQTYTLTIVSPLKISAPVSVPTSEVARPVQLQLSATGGKAPYKWSPASGTTLPAGVALNATTGVLSGKPSAAGTYDLKLDVTDALGQTDTLDVKLVVAPKLAVTTRTLVTKVGRLFHARLRATGGISPDTWTILHGRLPAGVHLDRATGVLSGEAHHAGTSRIVLRVRDALGAVSTARIVLTVGS
jgi:large repetitive protein